MLDYPDSVIPPLRFQYCPLCAEKLTRKVLFDDGIARVTCPACGWIQTSSNVVSVVAVTHDERGIVAIAPPGEDGVGLPAGMVEYGEAPEAAALREIGEETGLEAEIIGAFGHIFVADKEWPGPMVQFMYEAKITGGRLRGSEEGAAQFYPLEDFPEIVSSTRAGSQRAIRAFLQRREEA